MRPGGQMGVLYSYHVASPSEPQGAELTPLGAALIANGLSFQVRDLVEEDYRLALRRKQVLPDLRAQFEVEDCMFIYENRMAEADGMIKAHTEQRAARYLYHVVLAT